MITIRPSNITDNGTPQPVAEEEQKKPIPLVWIPATLVVGLLIAAIYLGARIVKARSHAKPSVVAVAAPVKPIGKWEIKQDSPASETPAAVASPQETTSPAITSSTSSQAAMPPPAAAAITPPTPLAPRAVIKMESPPGAQEFVGPQAPPPIVKPADDIPMITPRGGQRYVQVGALNPEATRRLVQRLRANKLDPHVAPGPRPEVLRVLIGPFDSPDQLAEEKKHLESQGVDTYVRKY